jgi:hypothetical protein
MADDLIQCPSCSFRLRLPPDLYGHEVECPQCHTRFTAPAPQAAAAPPRYDAVGISGDEANFPPPSTGGGKVTAPAIALLVTSLIGVWMFGQTAVSFIQIKNQPAEWDKIKRQALEHNNNKNVPPEQMAEMEKIMDGVRDFGAPVSGALAVLNLITVVGSIQMLRRRTYGLAMLGTIVALNPAAVPCCLLQLPFGIWALVVLLNADVRRSFR